MRKEKRKEKILPRMGGKNIERIIDFASLLLQGLRMKAPNRQGEKQSTGEKIL